MFKGCRILCGSALLVWALGYPQSFGQISAHTPGTVRLPSDQPPLPPKTPKPPKKSKPPFSTYLPDKPSWAPKDEIRVAPLGFAPPAPSYYLGRQVSLVSLDFLAEDRLLFTFHSTGLMKRETDEPAANRQIQALVLALPDGKTEVQASWTVPDRTRYLWMLKDGQFLVRTPDGLQRGDGTLELKPLPNLSGDVRSLALNPGKEIIVTTSPTGASSPQGSGTASAPQVAEARLASDVPPAAAQADLVMHAVRLNSGQVLLTKSVHAGFNAPVNAQGYVETTSPQKYRWVLALKGFRGESTELARVDSGCAPNARFITDQKFFLTTCTPEGGLKLAAIATSGHTDWAIDAPPEAMWPMLVMAPDGSRLAREALVLKDSVNLKKHPKFIKAVKGQVVSVIDAANGKTVFEAPLNPILDGGGNVAFSPSGRRIALLNNGAIQVFDLPPAAVSPTPANANAAH